MIKLRFIIAFALLLCSACDFDSQESTATTAPLTPTAMVIPAEATRTTQYPLYLAAGRAFFGDGQVRRMLEPDLLQHKVAYIDPYFIDGSDPLPAWLLDLIGSYLNGLGLTQVQQEQQGGALVRVGTVRRDDENTTLAYNHTGPTISLALFILNDNGCGNFISLSYLLEEHDGVWQAQQYQMGVC